MKPAIIVVTGASGSGKTAAVRALDARAIPGVRCYYFDSIGVPSPEEMERLGGGEQWQAVTTQKWIDRLASDPDRADVYVLDGQTRPSFVINAAKKTNINVLRIILLDCTPPIRNTRLIDLRGQPDLANSQMDCWAAYLRGQADALGLRVIDTTIPGIDEVVDALVIDIEKARADRLLAAASQSQR
ncbi:MAG: hypothetical protein C5B55_04455 [Blastocatellia bacterium]|nr:MAG: hypothetical protein C5B55_04455 [Blastocatellia bacterium]